MPLLWPYVPGFTWNFNIGHLPWGALSLPEGWRGAGLLLLSWAPVLLPLDAVQ